MKREDKKKKIINRRVRVIEYWIIGFFIFVIILRLGLGWWFQVQHEISRKKKAIVDKEIDSLQEREDKLALIERFLDNEDDDIRSYALSKLMDVCMNSSQWWDIMDNLKSANPSIRDSAMETLQMEQNEFIPKEVELIKKGLKDENMRIRALSAEITGQLLIKAKRLKCENQVVSSLLEPLIEVLRRENYYKSPPPPFHIFYVAPYHRFSQISGALTQIGEPAIPKLKDLLNDEDKRVRWRAARVLKEIG
jgi:HEAT repeat protein